MISPDTLKSVTGHWRINYKTVRPDIDLHGSPERALFRTAIEDETGVLYVLERISPGQRDRRFFISQVLDQLHIDGLRQISPYLKTPAGDFLIQDEGCWWQVSPFIAGTPLSRPDYIRDREKGAALARFLCALSRHAQHLSNISTMHPFSLKRYIFKLEREMQHHDPEVGKRFAPILGFLNRFFMDVHDSLPVHFCHGDYHPLNIIWQRHNIAAVIDWEFCGPKPDIYDIANLMGCIGMEHPSGLTGSLAMTFIDMMRRTSAISTQSWRVLPAFILALRFAWLAEWLRNKDKEMIDLEETYMNLLLDNRERLRLAWGLPPI